MSHSVGYATRQLSGCATIRKKHLQCCLVPVSLAILQVWVKVINEVIVRVVQPVVEKAWTVVHAFLWWQHHMTPLLDHSWVTPVGAYSCALSILIAGKVNDVPVQVLFICFHSRWSECICQPSSLHNPRSWILLSCTLAVCVDLSLYAGIFCSTGVNFSS